MEMEEIRDMGSRLFGVLLFVMALVIISIGFYSALTSYLDYNSEKVEVEGTVNHSEVDRDTSGRRGVSYEADIQYEYTYEGERYSNDNIKPGSGSVSMSRSEAESLVSEYQENESVDVHIDKNDPSRSWLVDELPVGSILTSLLIGFVGLFILYKKYLKDLYSDN